MAQPPLAPGSRSSVLTGPKPFERWVWPSGRITPTFDPNANYTGDPPRPMSDYDKRILEGYRTLNPHSTISDENVIKDYGQGMGFEPGPGERTTGGDPDYFFKEKARRDQYRAETGGPVFDAYRNVHAGAPHLSDDDIAQEYRRQYGDNVLRARGHGAMVDRAAQARLTRPDTGDHLRPHQPSETGFWRQKLGHGGAYQKLTPWNWEGDFGTFTYDVLPGMLQAGAAFGLNKTVGNFLGMQKSLENAAMANQYWAQKAKPVLTPGLSEVGSETWQGKLNWGAKIVAEQLPLLVATMGAGAVGGMAGRAAMPRMLAGSGTISGMATRTAANRAAALASKRSAMGGTYGGLDDVSVGILEKYAAGEIGVEAVIGNTAANAAITLQLETMGTMVGAAFGAASVTVPIESGGNILDLMNEGRSMSEIGGWSGEGSPVLFGILQGSLDVIGPLWMARKFFRGPVKAASGKGVWDKFKANWPTLQTAGGGILVEGPTEAAQEMLSFASRHYANNEPLFEFSEEEWDHIKEAGYAGAIMGGVAGAAIGSINKWREGRDRNEATEKLIQSIDENVYDWMTGHPKYALEFSESETLEITETIMEEGAKPKIEEAATPVEPMVEGAPAEVVVEGAPAEVDRAERAEVAETIYGAAPKAPPWMVSMAIVEASGTLEGQQAVELQKTKSGWTPEQHAEYGKVLTEQITKREAELSAPPEKKKGALDKALKIMTVEDRNRLYSSLGQAFATIQDVEPLVAGGAPKYDLDLQLKKAKEMGSQAHASILEKIIEFESLDEHKPGPLGDYPEGRKHDELMELSIEGVAQSPMQHALGAYIKTRYPADAKAWLEEVHGVAIQDETAPDAVVDAYADMLTKWQARAMAEIAPADITEENLDDIKGTLDDTQLVHWNTALERLRDELGTEPSLSDVLVGANESIRAERKIYADEQAGREQHVPLTPNRVKELLEEDAARGEKAGKPPSEKAVKPGKRIVEGGVPPKDIGEQHPDEPIDPGKRQGILQRAMRTVKGLGKKVGAAVREKIAREKPKDTPTVAQAKKNALEKAIKGAEAAKRPVTRINRIFALHKKKKQLGVRFTTGQRERVDKMTGDLRAAGYVWEGIDGTKVDGVAFTNDGTKGATEADQHLRLDDSGHTVAVETTKPKITHIDTREEEAVPEVVQHPAAKVIVFEPVVEAPPAEEQAGHKVVQAADGTFSVITPAGLTWVEGLKTRQKAEEYAEMGAKDVEEAPPDEVTPPPLPTPKQPYHEYGPKPPKPGEPSIKEQIKEYEDLLEEAETELETAEGEVRDEEAELEIEPDAEPEAKKEIIGDGIEVLKEKLDVGGIITISHVGATELTGMTDDALRKMDLHSALGGALGLKGMDPLRGKAQDNQISLGEGNNFLEGAGHGADVVVLHRIPDARTSLVGEQWTGPVAPDHTIVNWRKAIVDSGAQFVYIWGSGSTGDFHGLDFLDVPGYEMLGDPVQEGQHGSGQYAVLKKAGKEGAEVAPDATILHSLRDDVEEAESKVGMYEDWLRRLEVLKEQEEAAPTDPDKMGFQQGEVQVATEKGGLAVFEGGLDKSAPIAGTHKSANMESLKDGFKPRFTAGGNPIGISIARIESEELSSPTLAEPGGTPGVVSVIVSGKGLDYADPADRKVIEDLHEESVKKSEAAIAGGAVPGSPETMVSAIPALLEMGVDWVNGWNSIGEDRELHVLNPSKIEIVDRAELSDKDAARILKQNIDRMKRRGEKVPEDYQIRSLLSTKKALVRKISATRKGGKGLALIGTARIQAQEQLDKVHKKLEKLGVPTGAKPEDYAPTKEVTAPVEKKPMTPEEVTEEKVKEVSKLGLEMERIGKQIAAIRKKINQATDVSKELDLNKKLKSLTDKIKDARDKSNEIVEAAIVPEEKQETPKEVAIAQIEKEIAILKQQAPEATETSDEQIEQAAEVFADVKSLSEISGEPVVPEETKEAFIQAMDPELLKELKRTEELQAAFDGGADVKVDSVEETDQSYEDMIAEFGALNDQMDGGAIDEVPREDLSKLLKEFSKLSGLDKATSNKAPKLEGDLRNLSLQLGRALRGGGQLSGTIYMNRDGDILYHPQKIDDPESSYGTMDAPSWSILRSVDNPQGPNVTKLLDLLTRHAQVPTEEEQFYHYEDYEVFSAGAFVSVEQETGGTIKVSRRKRNKAVPEPPAPVENPASDELKNLIMGFVDEPNPDASVHVGALFEHLATDALIEEGWEQDETFSLANYLKALGSIRTSSTSFIGKRALFLRNNETGMIHLAMVGFSGKNIVVEDPSLKANAKLRSKGPATPGFVRPKLDVATAEYIPDSAKFTILSHVRLRVARKYAHLSGFPELTEGEYDSVISMLQDRRNNEDSIRNATTMDNKQAVESLPESEMEERAGPQLRENIWTSQGLYGAERMASISVEQTMRGEEFLKALFYSIRRNNPEAGKIGMQEGDSIPSMNWDQIHDNLVYFYEHIGREFYKEHVREILLTELSLTRKSLLDAGWKDTSPELFQRLADTMALWRLNTASIINVVTDIIHDRISRDGPTSLNEFTSNYSEILQQQGIRRVTPGSIQAGYARAREEIRLHGLQIAHAKKAALELEKAGTELLHSTGVTPRLENLLIDGYPVHLLGMDVNKKGGGNIQGSPTQLLNLALLLDKDNKSHSDKIHATRYKGLPIKVKKLVSNIFDTLVTHAKASASKVHKAKRGETLDSIARQHGVAVENLRTWNNLDANVQLRVGQKISVTPPPRDAPGKTERQALMFEATPETRSLSDQEIASRFNKLTRVLQQHGVPVSSIDAAFRSNAFQPTPNSWAIKIAMVDAGHPTAGSFDNLMEEYGHVVFGAMDPKTQVKLRRALRTGVSSFVQRHAEEHPAAEEMTVDEIRALAEEEQFIDNVLTPIRREGLFAEQDDAALAETIRRWWNTIIDYLLDAYDAIILSVRDEVSPELAERYFMRRMKSYLDGRKPSPPLHEWLGLTMPEDAIVPFKVVNPKLGVSEFNPDTGTHHARRVVPDSPEAAEYNVMNATVVTRFASIDGTLAELAGDMWENLSEPERMKLLKAAQAQMDDVNVPMADQVILAPNGQPSKFLDTRWYKMVRTDFFHRWAGGNWMVNPEEQNAIIDPATGEPMILWHVTSYEPGQPQAELETGPYERFVNSREYAYRYWVDSLRAKMSAEPVKDFDERMRLTAVVARADNILDLRSLGSGEVSISEIYDFLGEPIYGLPAYIERDKGTVSEFMDSGVFDEEMVNYDALVYEESSLPMDMQNIKAPQHKQRWVSPVYKFFRWAGRPHGSGRDPGPEASVKSLAEFSYRHPQDITKKAFDSDTITTHGWNPKHVGYEEETQPLEWDESKKSEFIEVKERPTVMKPPPFSAEDDVYIHDKFEPVAQQGVFTESQSTRFALRRVRDPAHDTPALNVHQENIGKVDIAANNFMVEAMSLLLRDSNAAKKIFGTGTDGLANINKVYLETIDKTVATTELVGGSVDGASKIEDLTGESRQSAGVIAMDLLDILDGNYAEKHDESKKHIDVSRRQAVKRLNMLQAVDTNYKDITWLYGHMWSEFRDLIRGLKKDTRSLARLGMDGGKLTEMLKALEKGLDKPTEARYTAALNQLLRMSSNNAFSNFGTLVDRLALVDIDYSRHVDETSAQAVERIANNIRNTPEVKSEFGENIDLANILASFMISNELEVHLLRVRRMKVEEGQAEIIRIFKSALTGTPADYKQAERLARTSVRHAKTATRLLQQLNKLKKDSKASISQLEREQLLVDFYIEAKPFIEQARIKLEQEIGEVSQWDLADRTIINVPTSKNMPPTEVTSPDTRKLYVTRDYHDYEEDLGKMTEWLENQPSERRGKGYYLIKTQRDALSMASVREALDIDTNYSLAWAMFSKARAPAITDRMRQVGLVEGLKMHQMFAKYAMALNRAMDLGKYGQQWTIAMGRAMRAVALRRDEDRFYREFYTPALKYIEDNRAELANMAEGEQKEKGISMLKEFYKDNSVAMANWKVLESFYRTTADVNVILRDFLDSLGPGAAVEEEVGGKTIYRKLIGNVWTVSRGFNDSFASTLSGMNQMTDSWGSLDSVMNNKNRFKYNFSKLYQMEEDASSLRALLRPYFNREKDTNAQKRILEKFLLPIISKSGVSSFKAPLEKDQVYRRQATPEELIKAYDNTLRDDTEKDIVKFAESLYAVTTKDFDSDMEMHEYVGEVLNVIRNFYTSSASAAGKDKKVADVLVPPRDLMDARETEQYPGEWLVYSHMDKQRIRSIANRAAMHASFGRDYSNFYTALGDANNRLLQLQGDYKDLQRDDDGNLVDKKQLEENHRKWREEAPANAHVTMDMLVNSESQGRMSYDLAKIEHDFGGFVKLAQGRQLDDSMIQEMVGVIAGGAVQGLKTVLNDTSMLVAAPIRNMGLNATATKHTLQTGKTFLALTANSLLNAAHRDFRFNLEFDGLVKEYGAATESGTAIMAQLIAEKNSALTNTQMIMAEIDRPAPRGMTLGEGKAKQATGLASAVAIAAGRTVTGLREMGIGQAKGGRYEAPTDVVLSPLGPFGTFALIGQMSATHALTSRVGFIVIKAAQHYADNPTDNRKISKDMLEDWSGLKNDKAISYVRGQLALHGGIDIDRLAKEKGKELRENGKITPFIDKEFVRMLHVVTQTTITQDSNPMTRPPSFITSDGGRAINPLLGWAVRQGTESTHRQFREEDFSRQKGLRKTIPYYTLPFIVAAFGTAIVFGFMRRKVEEDMLGYKSRDIPLNLDSPKGFVKSAADAMDRVGTMGIVGSLINEYANEETSRPGGPSNRILIFNTIRQLWNTGNRMLSQEHADYNNALRPTIQALGGGGYLQWVQLLNNAFSLDNAESRYTARLNAKNIIAAAGRLIDLPIKRAAYVGVEKRTSTPYMMQMQIAAYANDSSRFLEAHRQAVNAVMYDTGKTKKEAEKHVANNFASNHPFRSVFKAYPTESDMRELYSVMPEGVRGDVEEASRLYNHYLNQLGREGFMGKGADDETGLTPSWQIPLQRGAITGPSGDIGGYRGKGSVTPHTYRHGTYRQPSRSTRPQGLGSDAEKAYIQSQIGNR